MAGTYGQLTRRFRPLARYLAALPAAQQHAQLTLEDLEAILGPAYSGMPSLMPNWTAEGVAERFRQHSGFAARYDRHDRSITFTRQASQPLDSRPLQEA